MTRFAAAVLACLGLAAPALAQEKTYVLDTGTGRVTQKDAEQDAEIAALKAEVAKLKSQLTPTKASPAPVVAAADPFVPAPSSEPCPCGAAGCPLTAATPARTAATPATPPTSSWEPAPSAGLIYTVAPSAGSGGITSGCANGSCAAPSFRPVRRLFGR